MTNIPCKRGMKRCTGRTNMLFKRERWVICKSDRKRNRESFTRRENMTCKRERKTIWKGDRKI